MRDCRVVRFMPRLAAAPWAPAITPPDSRRVRRTKVSRGNEIAVVHDIQNIGAHSVSVLVVQRQMSEALAHRPAY
jgi:hypothetical protein